MKKAPKRTRVISNKPEVHSGCLDSVHTDPFVKLVVLAVAMQHGLTADELISQILVAKKPDVTAAAAIKAFLLIYLSKRIGEGNSADHLSIQQTIKRLTGETRK